MQPVFQLLTPYCNITLVFLKLMLLFANYYAMYEFHVDLETYHDE